MDCMLHRFISDGNIEMVKAMVPPKSLCNKPSIFGNTFRLSVTIKIPPTADFWDSDDEYDPCENYEDDLELGVYENETPLSLAVSKGNLEIVKYFVEIGKATISEYDNRALSLSIINEHHAITKYIIDAGVTVFNSSFRTIENHFFFFDRALLYACIKGNLELVKFFVENGADTKKLSFNLHVLKKLLIADNYEMIIYLIANSIKSFGDAIYVAINLNFTKISISLMTEFKARNDSKFEFSDWDNKLIVIASKNANFDIICGLVTHTNVDVNYIYGDTALDCAIINDRVDIAKFLVSHGAHLCATTLKKTVVDFFYKNGMFEPLLKTLEDTNLFPEIKVQAEKICKKIIIKSLTKNKNFCDVTIFT